MDVKDVRSDLIAEQESLDAMVAALTDEQWALATPSPRWAVSDQIGHLTFFDRSAALAITDPTSVRRTPIGADLDLRRRSRCRRRNVVGVPGTHPCRSADGVAGRPRGARRGRRPARQLGSGGVVRAVDGVEVVPHRPADGGLGTRPGHLRRRRRWTRVADRSNPPHRPTRRDHAWLELSRPRQLAAPDGDVRVELDRTVG